MERRKRVFLQKSNSSANVSGPTSKISLQNILLIFSWILEEPDPSIRIMRVHSIAVDTIHEGSFLMTMFRLDIKERFIDDISEHSDRVSRLREM